MSKARTDYLAISEFGQVEVGTVLKGGGEFYKQSKKRFEAGTFNEKNGYAWRKENDTVARLVIIDHGDWIVVTDEIMSGEDIVEPAYEISIEQRRENRKQSWVYPMGRRPNLEAEFGKNEVVCVIALPVARV